MRMYDILGKKIKYYVIQEFENGMDDKVFEGDAKQCEDYVRNHNGSFEIILPEEW